MWDGQLIGCFARDKIPGFKHTTVSKMTWRGSVRGGVIVVEDGSLLKEGDEVIIEKISSEAGFDDGAFDELKAKLQTASANADRGNFLTPHEVRGEIDTLRKNYKVGNS